MRSQSQVPISIYCYIYGQAVWLRRKVPQLVTLENISNLLSITLPVIFIKDLTPIWESKWTRELSFVDEFGVLWNTTY
jgi:hypothetical protein